MYDILQLNGMLNAQLIEVATALKLTNVKKLNKQTLVAKILAAQPKPEEAPVEEKRKLRTRKPIGAKSSMASGVEEVVIIEPSKPVPTTNPEPIPTQAPAKQGNFGQA